MKQLLYVFSIALCLNSTAQAVELLVCEGKLQDQDITLIDDGFKVGLHKGAIDIDAGPRGNNAPSAIFSNEDLDYDQGDEACTLTAQKEGIGSLKLEAPCDGNGSAKLKEVNIPSLELEIPELAVNCRLVNYRRQ